MYSAASYNYDVNGNLVSDLHSSVQNIAYNAFNMPVQITKSNNDIIQYRYDGAQNRIAKLLPNGDKEFYVDGVIVDGNGRPKRYGIASGYVELDANNNLIKKYTIVDWQGTVRLVVNAAGSIISSRDHYPYGKIMPGRQYESDVEGARIQFTGHEFDPESQYDYHGARYYNRELGRYMSFDPRAAEFPSWSPYNYTLSNPVMLVDPDGRGPNDPEGGAAQAVEPAEAVVTESSEDEFDWDEYFKSFIPGQYKELQQMYDMYTKGKNLYGQFTKFQDLGKSLDEIMSISSTNSPSEKLQKFNTFYNTISGLLPAGTSVSLFAVQFEMLMPLIVQQLDVIQQGLRAYDIEMNRLMGAAGREGEHLKGIYHPEAWPGGVEMYKWITKLSNTPVTQMQHIAAPQGIKEFLKDNHDFFKWVTGFDPPVWNNPWYWPDENDDDGLNLTTLYFSSNLNTIKTMLYGNIPVK